MDGFVSTVLTLGVVGFVIVAALSLLIAGRPATPSFARRSPASGSVQLRQDPNAQFLFDRGFLFRRRETIGALDLDAVGSVPWWKEGERETSLGAILVRMLSETERHTGHADIVRELIDGFAGRGRGGTGLPEDADEQWWREYVDRLEAAARSAATP